MPEASDAWKFKPGTRAVVVDPQGRVLLLHRPATEELFGDHWNLPGGGKEPGESFLAGAHRELLEETGLTATYTGISQDYTFPGGVGKAFLMRHPEGALRIAERESDEARWVYPDQLPAKLMPPTREIIRALVGQKARGLMQELDLTDERLRVERVLADAFAPWLEAHVRAIASEKGLTLSKAIGTPYPKGHPKARPVLSDLARPRYKGSDAEGADLTMHALERAAKLGRAEAARAILNDAKGGKLPPDRTRGFRGATKKRLEAIARRNVRRIRATTETQLAMIAARGEAADVDTLLSKLYSMHRSKLIAECMVAAGYAHGVADVLRAHGYKYVYLRTMGDDKVCKHCAPHEGRKYSLLQILNLLPLHPRCRCYPHTSPVAAKEPDNWRAKPVGKIVKSLAARRVPGANPYTYELGALTALVATIAPEPAPPSMDAIAKGALWAMEKAIAKPKPKPKPAKKGKPAEADLEEGTAHAPRMTMPQAVGLKHPDHLHAAAMQTLTHLRTLRPGSEAHAHVHKQYEALRGAVSDWHARRTPPKPDPLGDAPAFVTGGAAHLKSPRQFELAIHMAGDRDELVDLAHYMESYKAHARVTGPEWDRVWSELKAAIRAAKGGK
jgi:8-oxo-dGTP pyrophosphatase MutT (NUDIX family)